MYSMVNRSSFDLLVVLFLWFFLLCSNFDVNVLFRLNSNLHVVFVLDLNDKIKQHTMSIKSVIKDITDTHISVVDLDIYIENDSAVQLKLRI